MPATKIEPAVRVLTCPGCLGEMTYTRDAEDPLLIHHTCPRCGKWKLAVKIARSGRVLSVHRE